MTGPTIEPSQNRPDDPSCRVTTDPVRALREARSILLGGALGDSLGWPVEFLQRDEIVRAFGSAGITVPPTPALTSDDTEMTLALGTALVEAGEQPVDVLMIAVTAAYVRWLETHDPSRAPGTTCLAGARALQRGVPWWLAGIPDGAGCGAAMRVAPVGFLYQHDEAKLTAVAAASARATHGAPAAIAAAVGTAFAIKYALDGVSAADLADRVICSLGPQCPPIEQTVERFKAARSIVPNVAALESIGAGWLGHEALFMALLCVERHPDSLVEALRLAANINGDSDSVASIAGGIQGARLGAGALPSLWVEALEGRAVLEALAAALAEKKAQLDGAAG